MSAIRFLSSLLACAVLTSQAVPAAAETKWDLPVQWPPSNFYTKMIEEFADTVREETDGELVITVHAGGALGFKGPDMLAAVRDQIVSIGDVTPALVSGEAPFLGIDRIPFIFDNYEAFASFMAFARPVYDEIYAENNQLMLFIVPWPPTNLHTKTPVESLGDAEGRKIRTHDKLGTEFYQALGVSPIQLPWAEVVPSLAAGTIEGVNTSASSAVDGKFWEFLSSTTLFHLQWAVSGVNVNMDAFRALDPEIQDTVLRVARRLEPQFWLGSKNEDGVRLKTLEENGMALVPLPEDMKTRAREIALEQVDTFVSEIPAAQEALADWRAYRQ